MNCRTHRQDLMELARGSAREETKAALVAHVRGCASCHAFVDEQARLSATESLLAAEAASLVRDAGPDAALMAAFDAAAGRRKAWRGWWVAGAVAAAALIAVLIGVRGNGRAQDGIDHKPVANVLLPPPGGPKPQPNQPQPNQPQPVQPKTTVLASLEKTRPQVRRPAKSEPAGETEQPFVAIPFTAPMGPEERADIVQMDLPVSALIAAGFPMQVDDPGARARADLVVSEDGRARAVRLISISNSNSGRFK
jgi:hypothetical protein